MPLLVPGLLITGPRSEERGDEHEYGGGDGQRGLFLAAPYCKPTKGAAQASGGFPGAPGPWHQAPAEGAIPPLHVLPRYRLPALRSLGPRFLLWLRVCTKATRVRVTSRKAPLAGGGTKLGRMSPWAKSSAIPAAALVSVFVPGRLRRSCAFPMKTSTVPASTYRRASSTRLPESCQKDTGVGIWH